MEIKVGASHVYLSDGRRCMITEYDPATDRATVQVLMYGSEIGEVLFNQEVIEEGEPAEGQVLIATDPFDLESLKKAVTEKALVATGEQQSFWMRVLSWLKFWE